MPPPGKTSENSLNTSPEGGNSSINISEGLSKLIIYTFAIMKKLLVTGGSGLLGASIVFELNKYYNIYAIYNKHKIRSKYAKYIKLDLADKKKTERVINRIKPDIIIHTAAITNVDLCEAKPLLAKRNNIDATANITDISKKLKIKLVHISTDYIFDGKKGNYTELDKPNPLSVYAKTKLEAEKTAKSYNNGLIIRTSIYGWNAQKNLNFIEWVINNLREKKKINVLTDQITSMIFVNDLAKILKMMIDKDLRGVYNVASHKPLSKYKFALKTAEIFKLNKNLINPILTENLMKKSIWKAERPKNTSLNVSKIEKIIKIQTVEQSLNYMKEIENSYKKQFIGDIANI